MILTEDSGIGDYVIRAYEPGAITVNKEVYRKSLLVSPYQIDPTWPPQSLSTLKPEHFDAVLALAPEIVILGTGRRFLLPPQSLLAPLHQHHIGVECMDTGAACRTYAALMSEGRRVVAALLID